MKSLADLEEIRENTKFQLNLRHESPDNIQIRVGLASCGIAAGAREVLNKFVDEIAKKNLENVTVTTMGCIGLCSDEPVAEVETQNGEKTTYIKLTPEKVVRIVDEHIAGNKPVAEYTLGSKA